MFEFWIDALSILVFCSRGRVMMSFVFFKGCFSFCITDFSSPFRVLYQDDHDGETPRFVRFYQPIERGFYRLIGSESQRKMSAKRYLISVLGLGISSLLFLTVLFNGSRLAAGIGAKVDNLSFDLAHNTAVSFITNTNWQAYSGELAYPIVHKSLV